MLRHKNFHRVEIMIFAVLLISCLDGHLFVRLLYIRTDDTPALRWSRRMVQNWKAHSQLNTSYAIIGLYKMRTQYIFVLSFITACAYYHTTNQNTWTQEVEFSHRRNLFLCCSKLNANTVAESGVLHSVYLKSGLGVVQGHRKCYHYVQWILLLVVCSNFIRVSYDLWDNSASFYARGWAVSAWHRDALCQLKSCQEPRNCTRIRVWNGLQ